MAIPFLSNIDLKKNQITNVAVHNATSDLSTPSTGQIYFNTGSSTPGLRIYDGSAWVPVGKYTDLNFTTTSGTNLRTIFLRNGTTDIDSFSIKGAIGIGGITVTNTGEQINLEVASGAINLTKMAGSAIITSSEGVSGNSNDTSVPTTAAIKAYVDTVTTGALVYQGGYSAQSTAPPTGSTVLKGFTYTVIGAGTGNGFFSNALEVGDLIIAEQDNPTAEAHWTVVQKDIQVATASTIGYGNTVAATTAVLDGLNVSYSSGTATVGLDISSLPANSSLPSNLAQVQIPFFFSDSTPRNEKLGLDDIINAVSSSSSARIALDSTASGIGKTTNSGITVWSITVATFFGSGVSGLDIMVQVIGKNADTGDTVYGDVNRTATSITVTLSGTGTSVDNNYQVLLHRVA